MKRHIGQIAVVVSDQQHSVDFYSSVFGMDHIFGTAEFRGPDLDDPKPEGRVRIAFLGGRYECGRRITNASGKSQNSQ